MTGLPLPSSDRRTAADLTSSATWVTKAAGWVSFPLRLRRRPLLADLNEHLLNDIGKTKAEALAAAYKPFSSPRTNGAGFIRPSDSDMAPGIGRPEHDGASR